MQLSVSAIFLVVPAVLSGVYDEDCHLGKAGSCFIPKDLANQYQPTIKLLKDEIAAIYRTTCDRTASTRTTILKTIADSRDLTIRRLTEARTTLSKTRLDAKDYPVRVHTCIDRQNLGLARILPPSLLECNPANNFTALGLIRGKIAKLEQVVLTMSSSCLGLNPLRSEMTNLKQCMDGKISDIKLQMVVVEKEFDKMLQELIKYSTSCVLNVSSAVYQDIGGVLGAAQNCKFVP